MISLYRSCPSCGKSITYSCPYRRNAAEKKKTICPSCRTSKNNRSPNRYCKGASNHFWKGVGTIPGRIWSRLCRNASTRSLNVDITFPDLFELLEKQLYKCALTGQPIGFDAVLNNASVDRIDSSLGYTKDNIQIVLKEINIMKRDISNDRFKELCSLVATHRCDL